VGQLQYFKLIIIMVHDSIYVFAVDNNGNVAESKIWL